MRTRSACVLAPSSERCERGGPRDRPCARLGLWLAVDRDTNRSTGEPDLLPKCIHRQRAFVDEDFEGLKVGRAEAEGMKAHKSCAIRAHHGLSRVRAKDALPEGFVSSF